MQHRKLLLGTVLICSLWASQAQAGVWFEFLYAPCLTGNPNNIVQDNGVIGRYAGSIDCFNRDFNGDGARTLLSIKAFQPWEFGTMFLYYDITGPFNAANATVHSPNEQGGFFGSITVAVSAKKIAEKALGKPVSWGLLADASAKYEAEHVSKFGMLNYYGIQWDLAVSWLDFLSFTTVIRDDQVFEGVDFQIGGAWQKSFSLGSQDFIFGGFFSAGLLGEGAGVGSFAGSKGNRFFLTQPQLLWDVGKVIQFTPAKIYLGFEWQFAYNRYLIEGKTENVLQAMVRWNI